MKSALTLLIYSAVWKKGVEGMAIIETLVQSWGGSGMGVMKSIVYHPIGGKDSPVLFGEYTEELLYQVQNDLEQYDKLFDWGSLSARLWDFQTYATRILEG